MHVLIQSPRSIKGLRGLDPEESALRRAQWHEAEKKRLAKLEDAYQTLVKGSPRNVVLVQTEHPFHVDTFKPSSEPPLFFFHTTNEVLDFPYWEKKFVDWWNDEKGGVLAVPFTVKWHSQDND